MNVNETQWDEKLPPSIGLIGGVGPSVDPILMRKVLEAQSRRGRASDQAAIPVIVGQYACLIPDRTQYLDALAAGRATRNPASGAARVARQLAHCGARVLGTPCNTFHAKPIFEDFLVEVDALDLSVVNMVGETIKDLSAKRPHTLRIGVLSTRGTALARVYSLPLEEHGFQVLELDAAGRDQVHEAIYHQEWGLKSGGGALEDYSRARGVLSRAVQTLIHMGAEAVILACTELPLVFEPSDFYYDPLDSLARSLVETYLARELAREQIARI